MQLASDLPESMVASPAQYREAIRSTSKHLFVEKKSMKMEDRWCDDASRLAREHVMAPKEIAAKKDRDRGSETGDRRYQGINSRRVVSRPRSARVYLAGVFAEILQLCDAQAAPFCVNRHACLRLSYCHYLSVRWSGVSCPVSCRVLCSPVPMAKHELRQLHQILR